MGLDFDEELIKEANASAKSKGISDRSSFLVKDFRDLEAEWIVKQGVTAIYVYLVPRQLNEPYMKRLICDLARAKIKICSYSFPIEYLSVIKKDDRFNMNLYGQPLENNRHEH
jgi:hypothetical protein